LQNVTFSLSGNAIVLGIGFLLTPLIARVYGPTAYGQFAIFTAIASLIQPISTFQLPAGYVAAKDDEQFSAIIKISLTTLLLVTLFVFVGGIIYITFGPIQKFPSQLALALPLYLFFAGLFAVSRGWNIKLEEFKRSAQSKVVATLAGKSTTLGYGWFLGQSAMGMVTGSIVAFILESAGYVSKGMWRDIKQVFHTRTTFNFVWQTMHDFIEYPKYVTTNSIINNFSTQIPIYFIAAWYTTDKVGLFSLSLSLVIIPINLVGVSIGSVFLPKISAIIKEDVQRNSTIIDLYNKLFYPGLIALILLAISLSFVLPLILGSDWQGTGDLAALIASSYAMSIVALPLANTYRLINYERANLILTIIFLLLKVLVMSLALHYGNFKITIFSYLIINLLHHGFQLLVLFKKLRISFSFVIRDIIVLVFIYFLFYLAL
jgi:O-antigen/teichoic acid export membrane protein